MCRNGVGIRSKLECSILLVLCHCQQQLFRPSVCIEQSRWLLAVRTDRRRSACRRRRRCARCTAFPWRRRRGRRRRTGRRRSPASPPRWRSPCPSRCSTSAALRSSARTSPEDRPTCNQRVPSDASVSFVSQMNEWSNSNRIEQNSAAQHARRRLTWAKT